MSDVSPAELDGRPTEGKVLAAQIAEAAAKRPKSKNLKPLSRLGPIAWRYRGDVFAAIGFLVISTGSTLGLTGALRLLIDYGFSPQNAAALNQSFLVVGGVALLLGFATALRYFFVTKVGERIVADLRKQVYANILKLDAAFFMHTRTGEVLSRLTTDIQIVETLTTTSVSLALRNSLSVIGALIAMFIVDAKLTGWVLLSFPVVLAPLFGYGRRVGKLTATTQDRFAEAVGVASESLDALETVQAFGRETASATRFADAVEMAFGTSVQRIRARALMTALLITLVFGGITFVLWLGAQAVIHKEMTAGTLVQFVALSIFAAGAMANLGEAWGDVQKAAGAMQRIDELLRAEPKIQAPAAPIALPSPARGEIAFEDVVFAYPGREDRLALQGLSFRVAPGETVALVGPSGGGKSTVFRLLLRFYDPVAGVVRLDGVDLTAADPADVRSRIALVAQDAALFSGSAAENIRYGREDASLADIENAAARAQAGGFIAALPEGYDTRLGERAKSLSGGQKQRLAIARALVRDAPVLLLDEATSALDAENERLVQQALDEAVKGRTTLVIAHRLATVLRADRILVLDQGRVVEQGTHASLVAAGGLYARLAELQFDGGGGA